MKSIHYPGWIVIILQISIAFGFLVPPTITFADTPPKAAIASAHPLATQAGMKILAAGGNAFDAAVAVSAVLAVVEPYSSGIGGGGFWLLHRAEDEFNVMVDGRETAPAAAHRDLYLDKQGQVVSGRSMNGALSAGIPGEPAALVHLAENYGRLALVETLAPAIRYARQGFPVDEKYRNMLRFRQQAMQSHGESVRIFLHNGAIPEVGTIIRQADLATTLEALAKEGNAGFYQGEVARKLVAAVRGEGGIWTLEDLSDYRVKERRPILGRYHGAQITSAAPPSSGGIVLIDALNILSGFELDAMKPLLRSHVIIEAMRRAYRDRAQYLGDPDFVEIPVARLTHPWYAAGQRSSIRLDRATPSASLPGYHLAPQGSDTTHFSILDRAGNRVAATLSINYPFGSGFTAAGTGVLLNDELDDFSVKPGVPNAYGLVGAEANAVAAGKRPLSSMCPTFVEGEQGVAILGTPGGSRIISMVLLGVLDYIAGNGPESWVLQARFHHQFLPDVVQYESEAFTPQQVARLKALGHVPEPLTNTYGNMQAILWHKGNNSVQAASDPRGIGLALVR